MERQRRRGRSARELAVDIVTKVETEQSYSHLMVNEELKTARLDRRDANLVTELVYGTIQRLNTIDYFLSGFVAKGLDKLEPWTRNLLRISLYQLLFLDKIPEHAAVNEAVNLAKQKRHQGVAGMVNGVLRNMLRNRHRLSVPPDLDPVRRIALTHSHPEWLVRRWMDQFGEETCLRMCAANNEPPRVSLRVNALKTDRASLLADLRDEGIDAQPSSLSSSGILVGGAGNMALTERYRRGDFSIQDESSMLVAEALDPLPGMRVLDCCAAPGGKTAHLAELMGNRGEIWACDVHEHKEKIIRAQVQRIGADCVHTLTCDARNLSQRFSPASFDRILLDAPCSGLGVIRRKPDIKWRKSEREITALAQLQLELLEKVSALVKPEGLLVYSTCTITREENELVIAAFLKKHPDFAADERMTAQTFPGLKESVLAPGMLQILPHQYHSDGFFIARLRRLS